MNQFEYVSAPSLDEVPALLGKGWGEAAILAGGTDLLGRLKDRILGPRRVVNIKGIAGLEGIESTGGGLRVGALTRIAEFASHPEVRARHAALAQAAAAVATPQLRNMGTVGGNLCQRPRCWYFRNREVRCLKKGGDECFSIDGRNKYHAILGGGPCFIVHPSDLAPAFAAFGAEAEIIGPAGARREPLAKFFRLPDEDVERENGLAPNELLARVHVPPPAPGTRSIYLKFREKQSFDFAVSSVAALVRLEAGRTVRRARIVLGGVAPIPWRAEAAERALEGKALARETIEAAARAGMDGAEPMSENAYKVPLTRNLIRRALEELAAGS